MRKLTLEAGETQLLAERVTGVREGRRVRHSQIVVTDRRVVLLVPRPERFGDVLARAFGLVLVSTDRDVMHQIRRDDFAELEVASGDMMVFRSKGAGYQHISFEMFSSSPASFWQQRMRDWVAGDFEMVTKRR